MPRSCRRQAAPLESNGHLCIRKFGVRTSPGAATTFFQATGYFPTACLPRFAAAGTVALHQHKNSTSEFGLAEFSPHARYSNQLAHRRPRRHKGKSRKTLRTLGGVGGDQGRSGTARLKQIRSRRAPACPFTVFSKREFWTAAASRARRRFGKRSHPDSPCESAVVAALCRRSPNAVAPATQPFPAASGF